MFGTEWIVEEEFNPVDPWTEFESRWFESIREAMRKVKDGKRNVDSGSYQKARSPKKRARRKEGKRYTSKKTGVSS